jgi:hypothetical protein
MGVMAVSATLTAPPVSSAELERARRGVVRSVEEALREGIEAVPVDVRNAFLTLAGLEQANREHAERRRLANLAETHHYTATAGARMTLCGRYSDAVGVVTGWVGDGNEFIRRSRSVEGKVICPDCDRLAGP